MPPRNLKEGLTEKLEHYILFPLLLAAITGLVGWILVMGNRVSALEAVQPGLQEDVKVIRQDVREIRAWALGR